ncbi:MULTISPECIES: T9SS type A sorting domain-containing protein [Polaribacter]|uniref:T9SS type A sorting domain-containing protein n=1 Tax=Polaribacter sejongensis TaxID=985043 RepID=A0AAJ1QWZ5_9FLAO|nr:MULTISPECIES: T9SS type A sorting domain-containing protein [Polaribacter]AUC23483.1 hypothetical protein BTO15_15865 [Polaribacter sejongensis]MDN3619577.1 T9SS type A sorting domain-containing protein [Polaribacter undariae]UWD32309.1 T9SS type A sorting domain-containing protein [Polaribacter undariae]
MKKITFLLMSLIGISAITNAQVTATGSYSSDATVTITNVTTDEDNGDGFGDGAKLIDGSDATSETETAYFTFDGTMENGADYTINTTLYNVTNNFCIVSVALYNKTDGTELAITSTQTSGVSNGLQGMSSTSVDKIVAMELMYTATATDIGDVLEVRFIKTQASAARNYAIDVLKLNGTAVSVATTTFSETGNWSAIGDVELSNTNTDADNGDGVADGALYADVQAAVLGNGSAFTFDETMEEGDAYSVVTKMYITNTCYTVIDVSLFNVTSGVQLTTFKANIPNNTTVLEVSLSYTALASDEGDVLELRYESAHGSPNVCRDYSIDNVAINGSVISLSLAVASTEDAILGKNISIFPNPAEDIINIKNESTINIKSIKLTDITGREVLNGDFKKTIDVASFSRGIYLLKLESELGNYTTKKLILK